MEGKERADPEDVDAGKEPLASPIGPGTDSAAVAGGECDSDPLDPKPRGRVALRDRALGTGRGAQAAAVAKGRIDAQALVIHDPGPGGTGIHAGTAAGLLHLGMDAALRRYLREQDLRRVLKPEACP